MLSDSEEDLSLVEDKSFMLSLSDENFEHLTQASTGAMTGDWFVRL